MPKFMLLYRGLTPPAAEMPVDEHDEVMDRWGEWMERHGSQVDDPGFPFASSAAVDGTGADSAATELSGYTIVHADTVDAARELCRDHPFLHDAGPEYAVEIFELLVI